VARIDETASFVQDWSRGQKCQFSIQNGTSICDSHIDSYEYVYVFIETIYVNTVPNCLKYNVYDNIEANGISISEINIFGKYAQIWPFSSLLGEPKILTYQDELLKSFR